MLRHAGVDLSAARRAAQREAWIEIEPERRLAGEDVDRVPARKPVARPRDRARPDAAVRKAERDRSGILDVAALPRALRERDGARGRLHRDDLARDRPREIDAVTRP